MMAEEFNWENLPDTMTVEQHRKLMKQADNELALAVENMRRAYAYFAPDEWEPESEEDLPDHVEKGTFGLMTNYVVGWAGLNYAGSTQLSSVGYRFSPDTPYAMQVGMVTVVLDQLRSE